MRILTPILVTAVTLIPVTAAAQQKPTLEFENVRLGLPGGREAVFKAGKFAPVYADIRCNRPPPEGPLWLTVETTDSTDLLHTYTVPLPPISPGQTLTPAEMPYLPYTRPGSEYPTLRLSVSVGGDDPGGRRLVGNPFTQEFGSTGPSQVLIMGVGNRLASFQLPPRAGQESPAGATSNSPATVVGVDRFADLPDRWFGYDAVDLVVLPTGGLGDQQFAEEPFLNDPRDQRRAALLEWVRRGGQLVVSLGRNAGPVSQRPFLTDFLPVEITADARLELDRVTLRWQEVDGTSFTTRPLEGSRGDKITLADVAVRPERNVRVLLDGELDGREKIPLVFQSSYGLGRVTLLAFDLDAPPFSDWAEPASFWKWLLTNSAGRIPREVDRYSTVGSGDGELARIQTNLESFEGVPVVSFGWVALFILGYILLIGPLEYLFLKKVVGRLELTWITFPIVVIAVSVAAYFTAYSLKGDDLRVNKLDVVDIDLRDGRANGTTWATVFSPRIQSYDVGLVAKPGWSGGPDEGPAGAVLVSWLGETSEARQSLFRRSYSYHVSPRDGAFASGLESVPIQVWSTKAFEARWSSPIDRDEPVIESTLRHPAADPNSIVGTVTTRLPVPALTDARLIYRGQVLPLETGTLERGTPVRVIPSPSAPRLREWMGTSGGEFWSMLFHEESLTSGSEPRNAPLRRLDQSWRVSERNADEAILLARIPTTAGPAEQIDASGSTPTELWLDAIPGTGRPRGPLPGTLRQESYVRVYIPIPPAGQE